MLHRRLTRLLSISSRCRLVDPRDSIIQTRLQRYHSAQAVTEDVEGQQDDLDKPKAKYRFGKTRRINRTGQAFSEDRANLRVNTLGQPAEVLIIRDAEEEPRNNAGEEDASESHLKIASELERGRSDGDPSQQHQEILEHLQDEQRAKNTSKAEQQASVNTQLEKLRPQHFTGVANPVLSRTELAKLVKKLEGFTTKQLAHYYNNANRLNAKQIKDSSYAQQDTSNVPWWPWKPKERKSLHYFKVNGHKLLKLNNRSTAVSMILRQLWGVEVQGAAGLAGHVWRDFDKSADSALSALSVGSEMILSSSVVH
jgi:inner-membrane-bound regulator SLS-like protein